MPDKMDMTKENNSTNNDDSSLKSIRTWEIGNDEASTQRGSVSISEGTQLSHIDSETTQQEKEGRKPAVTSTPKTNSARPVDALPSFNNSSRVSQQPEGIAGWFLVRWLIVFAALWMSLFSWIGRCIGVRTDRPLPALQADTTNDTVSSYTDIATTPSIFGADADSMNTSRGSAPAASSVDAKTNLEKYCLLIKRQLINREIVLSSRDKKKLEKKCDYLLQWIDRNPYAKREDYVRGLDDVMRYSDKLSNKPPNPCPVM